MSRPPIYVTQPSLAPLEEFIPYLRRIWETGVMTHNGPLMQQLERELAAYLKVKNVVCLANGTCAIQLALRALEITGDVITTPFSFVATAGIIAWERCRPVFVDVDPDTWNIDPEKIEAAVTERTAAILPVHVFSRPCAVARIAEIARRRRFKVIYDAAHAMAVDVGGRSVLWHGDISALSFHATKLFNSAEGGACVTEDDALAERVRRMRFFGFDAKKDIVDIGMNAKMTEVSAGLGLANLKWIESVRRNRREKSLLYRELLSRAGFVTFQQHAPEEYNYSYMPVVFDSEERLLRVNALLERNQIFGRRYFHPSLNVVEVFGSERPLPVSERIAKTVLCLPLYDTLPGDAIREVCGLVLRA